MASNTPSARLGFLSIFVAVFLLCTPGTCSATPARPVAASTETVKVSELPPPTSGVLGLSRLIVPVEQNNTIQIYYPGTPFSVPGHVSYAGIAMIEFHCLQPTKRVAVNINPELAIYGVQVLKNGNWSDSLVIKELLFDNADDTMYIDLNQTLETDTTYQLFVRTESVFIDADDDRLGIQAFNSTNADTGETMITIGLSPVPDERRRFVPCFDDPAYKIPYAWNISVYYGAEYSPAVAMMNAPRTRVEHYCPEDSNSRGSHYGFRSLNQAFGATHFQIVPLSWIDEADVPQPDCISRTYEHEELLQHVNFGR